MNYAKYKVSELKDEIGRLGLSLPEAGSGKNGRVIKNDLIMVLKTGKVGKSETKEVKKKPKLVRILTPADQRQPKQLIRTQPIGQKIQRAPVALKSLLAMRIRKNQSPARLLLLILPK